MIMCKKLLTAVLTICVLLSAASCTVTENDVPNGMVRASSDVVDFDLFVPEEWTLDESGGAVSAYKSANDPTSVSVMAWNMPYADSTIADWWETYLADFTLVFTDFTLCSQESALLDGVAAEKYVYTGKLGEITYRYTQLASIRRGTVYLLTMTELADCTEDTAAAHQEDWAEISSAFRWR